MINGDASGRRLVGSLSLGDRYVHGMLAHAPHARIHVCIRLTRLVGSLSLGDSGGGGGGEAARSDPSEASYALCVQVMCTARSHVHPMRVYTCASG